VRGAASLVRLAQPTRAEASPPELPCSAIRCAASRSALIRADAVVA